MNAPYIPNELQSLLDDVQEDEIVDVLVDTNEIGMLLHAIAVHSKDDIDSLVRILEKKADAIREKFALSNRSPYA